MNGLVEKIDYNKKRLILFMFSLICFAMNVIRVINIDFWGDEGYSIKLANMQFGEMLAETAQDVHPPLYYIFVMLANRLFGNTPIVYHIVSFLPYIIILIIANTYVVKKWGISTSSILVAFASVLETSLRYNNEVRMYSWGELFIFISFLAVYNILTTWELKGYILLFLAALCGAYTHYYVIVMEVFVYLALLVYAICIKKSEIKNIIILYIATAVGYLPWLAQLLTSFKNTTEEYWIEEVASLWDGLLWEFCTKYEWFSAAMVFLWLGLAIYFVIKNIKSDKEASVWMLIGMSVVIGTILVGIIVSVALRPMYLVRYSYPSAIICWIMLGICISKSRYRISLCTLTIALLFMCSAKYYVGLINHDRWENKRTAETIDVIEDNVDSNTFIYTELNHLEWTILDYYIPGVPHDYILGVDEIDNDTHSDVLLIVEDELNQSDLDLVSQGYRDVSCIIEQGVLGTETLYIYHLVN